MNLIRKNLSYDLLQLYLVCLIPFALIFSRFVADFSLVVVCIIFIKKSFKENIFTFLKDPFVKFFILFWVIICFRSLFSENLFLSLKSSFFYIRFMLFAIAIKSLFELDKKYLYYFFCSISFCLMIIVFDGFIQFFYSKNIFGYPPFLMADTYRLSGFFKDELIIGSFISRILPFYLGLYMYCKYLNIIGNKDGYVSLFLLISCVLVLLSGERVALFYAFLSILMGALLINFLNIKWFLKLFTVGLIFISIILTHEGSKKRLIDKTLNQIGISNSKEELTDNDQIYIYSIHHHYHIVAAYKIFKDNIMFGSGVKMFREVCKDGYRENVFSCTTHPHNTIMQFLSETGIVGISFYFLSLFYVLKFMSINLWLLISNKDNNLYKAKIFYLLALLISLMPLLPSGNFFNNWISIINYLPVGFYLLSNKKNEL
tara:strand:+ start:67 stop:1353 length:1287 start_codon:yes stop_codon:yes gene_type:complete